MKTNRIILPATALLAAAALPWLGAAENTPKAPALEKHIRIIHAGDDAEPGERETVTFLGVETAPAGPALAAQLGLKRGTGLVVNRVVPGSPAAAALQPHDILLRFNDQILIAQRQLAVLVQNSAEGEEVAVAFLRAGKEQTARIKLGRQERPKLSFFAPDGEEGGLRWQERLQGSALPGPLHEEIARSVRVFRHQAEGGAPRHDIVIRRHGGSPQISIRELPRAVMLFKDDAGEVQVRHDDGKRFLTVRDAAGKETFTGEITTPEQREKLPPGVAERLGKLEVTNSINLEPPPDLPVEHESLIDEMPAPAATGVSHRRVARTERGDPL